MTKKKIPSKAASKAHMPVSAKTPRKTAPKKTAPRKTAGKTAARKPPRKRLPAATANPPRELIARTAYFNFLHRLENDVPGDAVGDWLAAENSLSAA